MMKAKILVSLLVVLTLLAACSSDKKTSNEPAQAGRPAGMPTAAAAESMDQAGSQPDLEPPYSLVSAARLMATLEDLTAIQAHSGWRNSATEGEFEALDYLERHLAALAYLQELGLELERQDFHVFCSTEFWQSELELTVDGKPVRVPADALRGDRDRIQQALRVDTDGRLNDSDRNPKVVTGPILVVRSELEIDDLEPADVQGKVVLLDYAAIDQALLGTDRAVGIAWKLVAKNPAALVLVTQDSLTPGESHGTFVGDGSALRWVEAEPNPPALYVRLEDLAPAGIHDWDDLEKIEEVTLTVDQDVFVPGTSGNLMVRIPGADPSAAMILGAHVDSPNSPGAMDDGSGSAVLLEVARVLDEARRQPPVDLVLVWFGSEELGLYGSAHFALTHQELLDRAVAMLQTDMLSRPLDGIDAYINLITWSYGRMGDGRLLWPEYLEGLAGLQGIETYPVDYYGIESDNSSFTGFDVPNANMIYANMPVMERLGPVHYATHIHDPYDTVETAREMDGVLAEMARLALAAGLETGSDRPAVRVAPQREYRAVFVASHTESIHMAPTTFIDMGMALAWEGYDVDVVPYGQAVTTADLQGANLVVVLPVVDYPSADGDVNLYDEAWSDSELAVLTDYANRGGLLVLTNSANRLKYGNTVLDPNEDWPDMNVLAEGFGVRYLDGNLPGTRATTLWEHPLAVGETALALAEGNAVPFEIDAGQVLAEAAGKPVAALVDVGDASGQVLVLGDVGILGAVWDGPQNLFFWRNLARHAMRP